MEKIDFFGGCHGNFLELMINLFIYNIKVDQNFQWFDEDIGSCHRKDENPQYIPKIKCNHWSYNNVPFGQEDLVIEIHSKESDMLCAITNSFLRAGDQMLDINHLHTDTIKKLLSIPKAKIFLDTLINEHGIKDSYPKKIIRNYFYSMFDAPEYGINKFNNFNHSGKKYIFPFDSFFDITKFYLELNQMAYFLEFNFYPTGLTSKIWNDFIKLNQGLHSHKKCDKILAAVLNGNYLEFGHLNLIEEAWIIYRISRIFRLYDHPLLSGEYFPIDTSEIAKITNDWKSKDYPR